MSKYNKGKLYKVKETCDFYTTGKPQYLFTIPAESMVMLLRASMSQHQKKVIYKDLVGWILTSDLEEVKEEG